MIGGLLRVLILALVMLVAVMFMLPRGSAALQAATVLDAPRVLPAVVLTDQDGAPLALSDLAGKPTLVFFGFTNCPDICPTTLAVMAEAVRKLGQRSPGLVPQVLFVSVDPARDSPDQIRRYLAAFDPSFIGATADEQALAPLLEAMAVTVHIETHGEETYRITHSGTIYVLDQAGRWAALFGGSSQQPDVLVSDYLALRAAL